MNDQKLRQLREESDRIKRAQRKSYIAVAVTLILAGVLITRLAGLF